MDSELLFIAFTTINGYVFAKYRYCLLVYETPFLEIHPFTGGGATYPSWFTLPPTHNGWGVTYPSWFTLPPTQIFEQWMAMGSELLLITF